VTRVHPIHLRVPAKINLILRVGERRPDGFHALYSLMQKVGLYDELTLAPAARLELRVSGLAVPAGADNLVLRAARRLAESAGAGRPLGARIELQKRIPVAAGLGGGSGDAAATLVGLNRLWRLGLARRQLAELGRALGSDLPFFFGRAAAWVEGAGERVRPVRLGGPAWAVLVNPGVAVSTAWAYAALDDWRRGGLGRARALGIPRAPRRALSFPRKRLTSGLNPNRISAVATTPVPLANLLAHLSNDLEPITTAAHPVIAEMKRRLAGLGAAKALMSGSGPTVFGVFFDPRAAAAAAHRLGRERPKWGIWVAPLLRRSPF
jgi:4-diphosphocytidyl-2-C-methyl-D-erythritol kinase